jgi:adenylosuccinate lyase
MGREEAHELIKGHAVAAALHMRETGADTNDLVERLADDARYPLDAAALDAVVGDPLAFVGDADRQIDRVLGRITEVVDRHPSAAAYDPEPLL